MSTPIAGAPPPDFCLLRSYWDDHDGFGAIESRPQPDTVRGRGRRAAQPKPIDYDKPKREATDLLSKYIQINASNPPATSWRRRSS